MSSTEVLKVGSCHNPMEKERKSCCNTYTRWYSLSFSSSCLFCACLSFSCRNLWRYAKSHIWLWEQQRNFFTSAAWTDPIITMCQVLPIKIHIAGGEQTAGVYTQRSNWCLVISRKGNAAKTRRQGERGNVELWSPLWLWPSPSGVTGHQRLIQERRCSDRGCHYTSIINASRV